MRRHPAAEAQRLAADPAQSTWLGANAGSGKTRVLTDRVARLLLGGTEPARILCLTYTKAAAAEMQNRLLARLGAWAMLPDTQLRAELQALGEPGGIEPARLAQARRLFAQAIEAPGGLKIQTIHAFCASLLRRFPLEAGVPHGFAEMDERAAALLCAEVLDAIAVSPEREVLDGIAAEVGEAGIAGLLAQILGAREAFARPMDPGALAALLGAAPGESLETLAARLLDPGMRARLREIAPHLAGGLATDANAAEKLGTLPEGVEGYLVLEALLLTGAAAKVPFSAKTGTLPTKKLHDRLPEGPAIRETLDALAEALAEARPRRLALGAARRAAALHAFAGVFLPRYARAKALRGWLDFDDLITRAAALLSQSSRAQWVLYRLDGGLDHILVDEAQDTSPAQWQVIEALTAEFTAGEGARESGRTVFVVGDRKQSIYSFQGADLGAFEATRGRFAAGFAALGTPMQERELAYSFRSSAAILRLVDATFEARAGRGIGGAARHLAFHDAMPGRVDLWPAIARPKAEGEETDWDRPLDMLGAEDTAAQLAVRVAREIAAMIRTGVRLAAPGGPRPVHEGDILVLVRRRGAVFREILRACKAEGLEVAGADRLALTEELAVRDLLALLAFIATPQDDLSLAVALRSPLLGLDEDALFRLAHGRRAPLWDVLRGRAESDAALRPARDMLSDLLGRADFLRPYELIERILVQHHGRARLLARLGREAEEGIDALLAQALAFESTEVPSLTGFLGWIGTGNVEVKRQGESAGRAIRVMTVHGAKGLEAPIVILPDLATPRARLKPGLRLVRGRPVLAAAGSENPEEIAAAGQAELAAEAEERMRLLYVALTRAESWLILCAEGEVGTGEDSWYSMTAEALAAAGAVQAAPLVPAEGFETILRLEHGDWPAPRPGRAAAPAPAAALPAWATQAAPARAAPAGTVLPSGLGGAKVVAAETFDPERGGGGTARGRLVHALIEAAFGAPPEARPGIAARLLEGRADAAGIAAEAFGALDAAPVARMRAAGALSEAEFAADVPGVGLLAGAVDLLLVERDRVIVVDFKTNAVVPAGPDAVPEGLLRQMGAYRAALQRIYPGRGVETALFWTAAGALMPLGDAQVEAAFGRATRS